MPTPSTRTVVVDDDCIDRESIVKLLTDCGFAVQSFVNGQSALRYVRSHAPPDVVIIDLFSPVMDTERFVRELDRIKLERRPWVIVASGSPSVGREWAANRGCAGFLQKPINQAALLDELQRCLNQTAETVMPVIPDSVAEEE